MKRIPHGVYDVKGQTMSELTLFRAVSLLYLFLYTDKYKWPPGENNDFLLINLAFYQRKPTKSIQSYNGPSHRLTVTARPYLPVRTQQPAFTYICRESRFFKQPVPIRGTFYMHASQEY